MNCNSEKLIKKQGRKIIMKELFKRYFCISGDYSKRIEVFDFYRGLAVLLVLIQHAGIPYGKIILAFHMPLFFVLSGYMQYETGSCEKNMNNIYIYI
jgi:hypothetical protein